MLLHRYTVFVTLFANGIPFYNSWSVFDHIPLSIYALQCYMYLSWTLITICLVVELLFLYNGVFLFLCVVVQNESYTVPVMLWRPVSGFGGVLRCFLLFLVGSYDRECDIDSFFLLLSHTVCWRILDSPGIFICKILCYVISMLCWW